MASEILTFLSSPLFALFFACVICALQIAGVITVNLARLFLLAAWLVAVVGTSVSLINAPLQHRAIAGSLIGIPAAIVLILVERWISKAVKKRENKAPLLLSNIELKRQAKQLSDDILLYVADMESNDPMYDFTFGSNRKTKNPNSPAAIKRANDEWTRHIEQITEHSTKRRNEFAQRFGVRYETIKKELEKRGINPRDINEFYYIATNPLSMRDGAIQISAWANQLPDNQ